jgi:4-amino-4-deoxy-L-arabinose transferase-like glycosyltransferase
MTTVEQLEQPGPWFDRHGVAIAAVLAAAVAALLAISCSSYPLTYAAPADEGYYRTYVEWLSQHGLDGYPQLFTQYLSDPKHWLYPSPVRVAFYVPAALLGMVFSPSFELLTGISIASHALLVGLVFLGTNRILGRAPALGSALLVACSPLLLGLGRRALSDSYATLWAMLAVYTYLDLVRSSGSWRRWVAFTLGFAAGILAKETTVLLVVPFAAWPFVTHRGRPPRALLVRLAAAIAATAVVTVVAYMVAAGGWTPFYRVVRIIVDSPATNPYALKYGSGPWTRYLVDLLLLSPLPLLLGVAMAVRVLARDSVERRGILLFFVVLAAGVLIGYEPFTKNIRYVAILVVPLAVLTASFLHEVSGRCPVRVRRAVFAAALALLCALELLSFRTIFLQGRTYDPVTYRLLIARDLIPRPDSSARR